MEGRSEGEAATLLRLLARRWGPISPEREHLIRGLSSPVLEDLTDVLLDLRDWAALEHWVRGREAERT